MACQSSRQTHERYNQEQSLKRQGFKNHSRPEWVGATDDSCTGCIANDCCSANSRQASVEPRPKKFKHQQHTTCRGAKCRGNSRRGTRLNDQLQVALSDPGGLSNKTADERT